MRCRRRSFSCGDRRADNRLESGRLCPLRLVSALLRWKSLSPFLPPRDAVAALTQRVLRRLILLPGNFMELLKRSGAIRPARPELLTRGVVLGEPVAFNLLHSFKECDFLNVSGFSRLFVDLRSSQASQLEFNKL